MPPWHCCCWAASAGGCAAAAAPVHPPAACRALPAAVPPRPSPACRRGRPGGLPVGPRVLLDGRRRQGRPAGAPGGRGRARDNPRLHSCLGPHVSPASIAFCVCDCTCAAMHPQPEAPGPWPPARSFWLPRLPSQPSLPCSGASANPPTFQLLCSFVCPKQVRAAAEDHDPVGHQAHPCPHQVLVHQKLHEPAGTGAAARTGAGLGWAGLGGLPWMRWDGPGRAPRQGGSDLQQGGSDRLPVCLACLAGCR